MAIIKAVNSKSSIGRAINYVLRETKTQEGLVSGINCDPDVVREQMYITKRIWDKMGGRTYKHFIQSYHEDENITPEQAHENAVRLCEGVKAFEGYEVLIATHTDKSHIHSHIIVNSVRLEDGVKLRWAKKDLEDMKKLNDKINREQGLNIPEKGMDFEGYNRFEPTYWRRTAYKFGKNEMQNSSIQYIHETIEAACSQAKNQSEFIKLCQDKGVAVNWTEKRKYITFSDENIRIRDKKLNEYFDTYYDKKSFLGKFYDNFLHHEYQKAAEEEKRKAAENRSRSAAPTRAQEPIQAQREELAQEIAPSKPESPWMDWMRQNLDYPREFIEIDIKDISEGRIRLFFGYFEQFDSNYIYFYDEYGEEVPVWPFKDDLTASEWQEIVDMFPGSGDIDEGNPTPPRRGPRR